VSTPGSGIPGGKATLFALALLTIFGSLLVNLISTGLQSLLPPGRGPLVTLIVLTVVLGLVGAALQYGMWPFRTYRAAQFGAHAVIGASIGVFFALVVLIVLTRPTPISSSELSPSTTPRPAATAPPPASTVEPAPIVTTTQTPAPAAGSSPTAGRPWSPAPATSGPSPSNPRPTASGPTAGPGPSTEPAPVLYARGERLHHEGKFRESVAVLQDCVRVDPAYYDCYNVLAMAYREVREYDRAEDAHRHAVEGRPARADYFMERGVTRRRARNVNGALEDIRQCINLDPNFPRCYHELGIALRELGRRDESIEAHTKAITMCPGQHDFYRERAATFRRFGDAAQAAKDDAEADRRRTAAPTAGC
jgi:hypothetical protein